MIEPLDAWVCALDEKWCADQVRSPSALVIEYVIADDAADAPFTYHLVLGPGGDRALVGPADRPDATFRLDRATAEDIRAGRRSSEAAFLSGELVLVGDAAALIEAHRARLDA